MAAIELRFTTLWISHQRGRRVIQEIITWSSQNLARLSKKLSFTLVLACINKGRAINDEHLSKKRIVMGGTHGCNNLWRWVYQRNTDVYHRIERPLTFSDGAVHIRGQHRLFRMLFWANCSLLLRLIRSGFLEKRRTTLYYLKFIQTLNPRRKSKTFHIHRKGRLPVLELNINLC